MFSLPADELQSDTLLFLADVIYFKGVWQDRFEDVKVGRFHVSDVEKVETEMMFISGKFNHAEIEELDAKVVNLPYKVGSRNQIYHHMQCS